MNHQAHAARVDADSLLSQIIPKDWINPSLRKKGTYAFATKENKPCCLCGKLTDFYFEVEINGVGEERPFCSCHGPVKLTTVFGEVANSLHWRNIRINRRKLWFKIQLMRKLAGKKSSLTFIPGKTYSKGET